MRLFTTHYANEEYLEWLQRWPKAVITIAITAKKSQRPIFTMRMIQLTALGLTLCALLLLALMQSQASNSAAPSGGVLFFAALIAVPMCLAAAVFATISSLRLRTSAARKEHGFTSPLWWLVLALNSIQSIAYIGVLIILMFG